MLFLVLAGVVGLFVLIGGLTVSVIDVDRYSFGLYFMLVGIVAFCIILALWYIKPRCLKRPNWAVNVQQCLFCNRSEKGETGEFDLDERSIDWCQINPAEAGGLNWSLHGMPGIVEMVQENMENQLLVRPSEVRSRESESKVLSAI